MDRCAMACRSILHFGGRRQKARRNARPAIGQGPLLIATGGLEHIHAFVARLVEENRIGAAPGGGPPRNGR